MTGPQLEVPVVVEGDTDRPFAQKLVRAAGGVPGTVYAQGGKFKLLKRIGGYANGARSQPWLVLVDLDEDEACAPAARRAWEPIPAHHLVLRVVVRAVEAWALGDQSALQSFFGLRSEDIPLRPEEIQDPKARLVDLARTSRRAEVRRAMVPHSGSGRRQGPEYEARLIEFGENHWSLQRARHACPSLERAVSTLSRALGSFSCPDSGY